MASDAEGGEEHFVILMLPEIGGIDQVALRDETKSIQYGLAVLDSRQNALRHAKVDGAYALGVKVAMSNGGVTRVIGNGGERRCPVAGFDKGVLSVGNILCCKKPGISFVLQIVNRTDRRYPRFEIGRGGKGTKESWR
jgi:hypothetical protein